MYALTLTQPWATLVAIGAKQFETRSWQPPSRLHKQQFAIHAGKGLKPVGGKRGLRDLLLTGEFYKALSVLGGSVGAIADRLPYGAIVAVVTLADVGTAGVAYGGSDECPAVRWSNGKIEEVSPQEAAFGDYTPGRKIWRLANVIALPEPVACSGWQMLWRVPSEVEAEVQRQFSAEVKAKIQREVLEGKAV